MSVCNLTANIANSIVGSAVLTLPTGMERLSDNGMATSEALGVGVVLYGKENVLRGVSRGRLADGMCSALHSYGILLVCPSLCCPL